MRDVGAILFGAAFTVAACAGAGRAVVVRLQTRLDRTEEWLIGFVTGAALLSLIVFLLAAVGLVRPIAFLLPGAAAIALGLRPRRQERLRLPLLAWPWRLLFLALFLPFSVLYLAQAMGPEYSPDGSTYHLAYVLYYLRNGGFGHITTSIYASLSQGMEMLFLFAFAFGRHSAAAMVHFAFLLALVFGMVCYGRRFGIPKAGVCAALLVYLSPVFGFDATAAYNDVAAGCTVFFLFYVLEIWDERREAGLLILAGLLAGFAYAIKYTAFPAVAYAVGFVLWRSRRVRPAALVALFAALLILPWMAKDWLTVGNPFSPFLNRCFPNPYTNLAFEQEYVRTNGIHRDGFTFAGSVTDVTVRGRLSRSLLGPVFLLSPLALVSLRRQRGRRLLAAAAVMAVPWFGNVDTRMLIPAAVLVALALAMAMTLALEMAHLQLAIPIVLAAHALLCWPAVLRLYADPLAARVRHFLPREALRIVPQEATLEYRLPGYRVARMIERLVPAQGRVFAFSTPPRAYTSREVLVWWESSFNEAIKDVLLMPIRPEMQPSWRLRFDFPRQRLRAVRVLQTARDPGAQWSIGEIDVAGSAKVRAWPNPWDARWAFDRNPLTRWRSLAPLAPGMHFDVDFGEPRELDSLALNCAHDQWGLELRLEGETSPGRWTLLAAAARKSENAPLGDLRRAAVREIRARGITHVLIRDADFGADDFRARTQDWGMALAGEAEGQRLYALSAGSESSAHLFTKR